MGSTYSNSIGRSKYVPTLVAGLKTVGAADGWGTRGLFTGGIPTLIGYSIQGMCNSGSTKCSRMSMPELLEKMPINIRLLDGLSHQPVPRLLLMLVYAHGKLLKSECKHLKQEHSHLD